MKIKYPTTAENPRFYEARPRPDRRLPEMPTTKPIEALIDHLGPQAVFGEPVQVGATMVIPVAKVRTGFGVGGGRGRSAGPKPEGRTDEGSGSGGGAGARVIPRGYLRITEAQVRFEPILDVTRLLLGGLALGAWITYCLSRSIQH